MILDKIENLKLYGSVVADAALIADYVTKPEVQALPAGRYDIPGTACYMLVQDVSTQPEDLRRFETHINYGDIQIVLSGREIMQWAPAENLTPAGDYNPEKDVRFYVHYDDCASLRVTAGQFALFVPSDGHKPLCADGQPCAMRKIVVKFPV